MAVYIALALEAIGDITASSEVSRLSVDGPEFDSRIQGWWHCFRAQDTSELI